MATIQTTKAVVFHSNTEILNLFKKLFPNIPLLIATIIAFTIVFITLTYFFYKPVKRMLKARHDLIQKNIDDSIENKKLANASLSDAQNSLVKAKIRAAEIVNKAKFEAEKVVIEYTNRATREAELIKANAEQEIINDKKRFEEESKHAIIDVAFEIANKIVKKKIQPEKEKKLIEEFLK